MNERFQRGSLPPTTSSRIMLLTTTTGYQTQQFIEAAKRIGVSVAIGSDRCHQLEDPWQDGALPLRFECPTEAAAKVVSYGRVHPLDGIVALGDCTPPTAARASATLGLAFHSIEAADTCRDKYLSRTKLAQAGLKVPPFFRYRLEADPRALVSQRAPGVEFPCVLKPLSLSASRGVIRADDPGEFIAAFERVRKLLQSPELRVLRQESSEFIQVERYVEGDEFAVEGVVDHGQFKILAIFDKPDPLTGPYFAETLYVTPSRLDADSQKLLKGTIDRAVEVLGLYHGPVHAEVRINASGVWLLETAARPIGGLCSRALRFHLRDGCGEISLEELLIRLSIGERNEKFDREPLSSGVMMIPILEEGIVQRVDGLEQAREVPGIEEIILTARPAQRLVPWPEGSSYPGFIFARGNSPEDVERSLRQAHARLQFVLAPVLPVV